MPNCRRRRADVLTIPYSFCGLPAVGPVGTPPSRARAADWRSRSERRVRVYVGAVFLDRPWSANVCLSRLTRWCDAVGALRSARRSLRERRDTVSAARSARRGRRGEFGRVDATRLARSARSARRVCVVAGRRAWRPRRCGRVSAREMAAVSAARQDLVADAVGTARRGWSGGSRRPRREVAADVPCSGLRAWSRWGKRSRSRTCSPQRGAFRRGRDPCEVTCRPSCGRGRRGSRRRA